jgi:hypothetical protein
MHRTLIFNAMAADPAYSHVPSSFLPRMEGISDLCEFQVGHVTHDYQKLRSSSVSSLKTRGNRKSPQHRHAAYLETSCNGAREGGCSCFPRMQVGKRSLNPPSSKMSLRRRSSHQVVVETFRERLCGYAGATH